MKKATLFLAGIICMLLTMHVQAQTSTADYFAGKWNVLIKGTPNGDVTMVIHLEKKDTTVTGVVQDTTGKEIAKITNAELAKDQVTVYFTAQGYDVYLDLAKKDEDHVTGSLMNMFSAEGDRIKEAKK